MKPTQEQIEAALRYADRTKPYSMADDKAIILAAAYRDAMAEIERLQPWADLAISSNALLEIERSKNKQ
jgi:hypothetical protein